MADVVALELPKIDVGRSLLSDVNGAMSKEWIVTNGIGGYASSTVLGVNSRKYHGLLVAAFNPPVTRWVLLSKLDETLKIGNELYDLGANEFIDTMHPKGYHYLSGFAISPLPTFMYDVHGISLQKTIFMPYLKNATVVIYEINNPLEKEVTIKVSPLVNSRHIYSTTNIDNIDWCFIQKSQGKTVTIEPSLQSASYSYCLGASSPLTRAAW